MPALSLHGLLIILRRLDISIFSRAVLLKMKTIDFLVQLRDQLVLPRRDTVNLGIGYIIDKSLSTPQLEHLPSCRPESKFPCYAPSHGHVRFSLHEKFT
jgi:hypothetical protein